jgi:hypothetical protein
MQLAIVCSAHGFGHLTRQLALAACWRDRGVDITFFTAAPRAIVDESLPGTAVIPWTVDVGIAQRDSLSEDLPKTARLLTERCTDEAIDALSAALSDFDGVIIDIAPAGLEAARRAGVPAVAVGNFSWPWIYDRYPLLRPWAEKLRAWQRPHPAASLWPGPGLSEDGFASMQRAGLIGRRATPWRLPAGAVLVSFGGLGLAALDRALPRLEGVCWVLAPPMGRLDRDDCLYVEGVAYPSLVAGSSAVLTKPGYGIFAEAALSGRRLIWVDRGAFPEAPHLTAAMAARGDVAVGAAPGAPDFAARLSAALGRSSSPPPPAVDDTARLAESLLTALSQALQGARSGGWR